MNSLKYAIASVALLLLALAAGCKGLERAQVYVDSVSWSPDGRHLLVWWWQEGSRPPLGYAGRVFQVKDGYLVPRFDVPARGYAYHTRPLRPGRRGGDEWSPSGDAFLAGRVSDTGSMEALEIWRCSDGSYWQVTQPHEDDFRGVWSSDGTRLAIGGWFPEDSCRVVSPTNPKAPLARGIGKPWGWLDSDTVLLATRGGTGTGHPDFALLSVSEGKQRAVAGARPWTGTPLSPVVVGGPSREVWFMGPRLAAKGVYAIDAEARVRTLFATPKGEDLLFWWPADDGQGLLVVTYKADRTQRLRILRQTPTGLDQVLSVPVARDLRVDCAGWAANGRFWAVIMSERGPWDSWEKPKGPARWMRAGYEMRVWDTNAKRVVLTKRGSGSARLAFSPDGKRLALVDERRAHLYHFARGKWRETAQTELR